MKNLINYYYNFVIGNFKRVGERFLFEVDKYRYEFLPFENDIGTFQKIYTLLINNNKYCHEVVMNKDKSLVTFYENKPYILLKKNLYIESKITFDDILYYDAMVFENKLLDWKKLWKEKIDYYEYQISHLGLKYKTLRESMGYYIGLSENAISLLNFVDNDKIRFYSSHRRINYDDNMDMLFNPINIVIDNRTRDISEFLKSNYINGFITLDDTFIIIERINFEYDESLLLLARLLYPSYYFDLYDKIIQEQIPENKIDDYIKKNVYYETFVKSMYKYLRYKYNIPEIEWLES